MKRLIAALALFLAAPLALADNPLSVSGGGVSLGGTNVWTGSNTFNARLVDPNGYQMTTATLTETTGTVTLTSTVADGANTALVLNNSTTLTNSSAILAAFQNNGTEKARIEYNGRFVTQGNVLAVGTISAGSGGYTTFGAATFKITSTVANSGSPVAGEINTSGTTLSVANSRLWSYKNNTTEQSYVDKDGSYVMVSSSARLTCASCNAVIQGQVSGAGATESVSVGTVNVLSSTTGKIMAFFNDDLGNSPTSVSYVQKDGKYNMASGDTTGSPATSSTMNKPSGKIALSAGNSVYTLTNNVVQTATIPVVTVLTNDTTCWLKSVVVTANTLTITMVAACTADTSLGFVLHN